MPGPMQSYLSAIYLCSYCFVVRSFVLLFVRCYYFYFVDCKYSIFVSESITVKSCEYTHSRLFGIIFFLLLLLLLLIYCCCIYSVILCFCCCVCCTECMSMRPVHAYTLHAIFAFSTQPIADEIYGIFDCACVANTVLSYIWPAVEHHSLCDVAFLHTVLFFSLHSFINGNWFFIHVGIFYICCCSLATAAPLRFNCSVWRNGREWKRRAAPSDVLRLMRSVTCRWQRTRIRNRIKCTQCM